MGADASVSGQGAVLWTDPLESASLQRRLVVAGGGGGGGYRYNTVSDRGGDGGGLVGGSPRVGAAYATGGTQTGPGMNHSAGQADGGRGRGADASYRSGGGGAGWYGGGAGSNWYAGAGGSSGVSSTGQLVDTAHGVRAGNGRASILLGRSSAPTITALGVDRSVALSWIGSQASGLVGYALFAGSNPAPTTRIATFPAARTAFVHSGDPIPISSYSVRSSSATITTSNAHSITASDSVVIQGTSSPVDGMFELSNTPSATQVEYPVQASNSSQTGFTDAWASAVELTNGTPHYYRIAPIIELNGQEVLGPMSADVVGIPTEPTGGASLSSTDEPQAITVPAGASAMRVHAEGAQGGDNWWRGDRGGLGGRVEGSVPVAPGETLFVFVGGAGDGQSTASTVAGGWNGGGAGGQYGGGGGGATDVRRGFEVTSAVLENGVVTLTTAQASGVGNGEQIIVGGVGAPFDGVVTTAASGNAGTTIRYAQVGAHASVSGQGAVLWTDPLESASLQRRLVVAGGGGGGGYRYNTVSDRGGDGGGLVGGSPRVGAANATGGTQTGPGMNHSAGQADGGRGRGADASFRSGGGGAGWYGGGAGDSWYAWRRRLQLGERQPLGCAHLRRRALGRRFVHLFLRRGHHEPDGDRCVRITTKWYLPPWTTHRCASSIQ